MVVFRERFSSNAFEGPRAQEYSEPEDLFQQLVGAAVREIAGPLAHVGLTSGRDGAIDTWVENAGDPEYRVNAFGLGIPTPFIVECKYHDESARNPTENTRQGWRRVKTKLQEQADKNWVDLFAPWKSARGYLYCISNVIHPTLREELTAGIKEFFESLPPERKPPLAENTFVLDWGDIADQLNRLPRIADAWLGVRLENILGHEEYFGGLKGFRVYLKENNLRFVPPPENDPVHPGRIFEVLSTGTDKRGIIIDGPGGVGKTRTALEVAALAHSAGWRVLHVLPGEPPVTAGDILAATAAAPGNVLLVLDYIDQMHELEFGDIRRRVIPEAEGRGIRLAFLANERPGTSHKKDEDREAVFEKILLRPDYETEKRISENIRKEIAPKAIGTLGEETVSRLCGRRPIIAMFVARELERCAKEGTLTAEAVADIGEGDLMTWLRKRLNEAHLSVWVSESFVPSEPEPVVVAAAAALAVAPIRREGIITATAETLSALNDDRVIPADVVDMLITVGWLEAAPGHIETAHDVVCDEVLERVLRTEPTDTIYDRALAGFLAPALSSPRILGRYGVALGRLLGTSRVSGSFRTKLEKATADWLAGNASRIGATLAGGDADEGAYAMGAAFVGPPWGGVYLNFWNELLRPWLDKHGRHLSARHLYYRLLKVGAKGEVAGLIGPALAWLGEHGATLEAGFVLPPLLGRDDLSTEERTGAVARALVWLDTHGATVEANFVLPPLLGRDDLSKQERTTAVARALGWLDIHGAALEAEFVLHPLLGRDDLSTQERIAGVARALAWLDIHGAALEADFVLPALLGRDDLSTEERTGAVARALAWLDIHGATLEGSFVLPPLLGRDDLSTEERTGGVARALAWLDIHGATLEARFVLRPFVGRDDLSTQERTEALPRALAWLDIHGATLEAGFVLPPLYGRDDLSTQERTAAVPRALAWLERFPVERDSEFVLKHLLKLPGLNRSDRNRCARIGLSRLAVLSNHPEATFILRWMLSARGLDPQIRRAVFDSAIDWLRINATHPNADFVINRILRNRDVTDSHWSEAASMALSWLNRTPAGADRDYILNSLLLRFAVLKQKEQEELIADALAWLETTYPKVDSAKGLISYIERHAGSALPPSKLEELKLRWGCN